MAWSFAKLNQSALTKFDTLSEETIPLEGVIAYDFCVDGQFIYYISMIDGQKAYQCSLDGTNNKIISDVAALDISCDKENIYLLHKGTGEKIIIDK